MQQLPLEFYLRDDVVGIARELIGKEIRVQQANGEILGGIICETEAYRAPEDKASHAYGMRRTARTETMFSQGGTVYVYVCYGIHELVNVVTNVEGIPHAVLIRGIFPSLGLPTQLQNRKAKKYKKGLMSGPGKVTQALGISRKHNNCSFLSNEISIYSGISVHDTLIQTGPRIGINYAQEWKDVPWRFWVDESELERLYITLEF